MTARGCCNKLVVHYRFPSLRKHTCVVALSRGAALAPQRPSVLLQKPTLVQRNKANTRARSRAVKLGVKAAMGVTQEQAEAVTYPLGPGRARQAAGRPDPAGGSLASSRPPNVQKTWMGERHFCPKPGWEVKLKPPPSSRSFPEAESSLSMKGRACSQVPRE